MMEGWKRVKIGDLGEVITGNTPPKKDPANYGGDYPFIKPTDMEIDRRYVTNWEENYSEKAFKRYKNSYIPPKATGVVTIGTVGEKIFQADRYCFTNQSVNVVIPNESYDEDFVYYVLKINLPKVLNANPGTASGRHHVSKSNFCAIKIDVPKSKETQRKIATILSAYDDLIENNLKRIKLLEEQAQLTYEEWFVRFKFPGHETVKFDEETGLPMGWEKVKLSKIATFMNGYAFKPKDLGDKGLPVIKIKEMKNGLNSDSPRNCGKNIPDKYIVENGDILFSWSASLEVVIWLYEKGLVNQHLFKVTPAKGFGYSYVYLATKNSLKIFDSLTTGATRKHIKRKELDFVKLNKPEQIKMNSFEKIVRPMFNSIINLSKQNQHLKEARDILLPRLMSGMIDPSTSSGQVVDKLEGGSLKYEVNDSLGMVAEENSEY